MAEGVKLRVEHIEPRVDRRKPRVHGVELRVEVVLRHQVAPVARRQSHAHPQAIWMAASRLPAKITAVLTSAIISGRVWLVIAALILLSMAAMSSACTFSTSE